MKLTLLLLAMGSLATGCAGAPGVAHTLALQSTPAHVAREPARATPSLCAYALSSDPVVERRVLVHLRLEGTLSSVSSLSCRPTHASRLSSLVVADSNGSVDTRITGDEGGVQVTLASHGPGSLDVRYLVELDGPPDPQAPVAEPTELRGAGEDLLLVPVTSEPMPIEVRLTTGGGTGRAASSFGIGNEVHATARADDLRHAFFVAGDVGTAAFHATDGDDFAAWIGFTSFDPRWVSAETAGARSAIDDYVDRAPGTGAPPISLLFSSAKRTRPRLEIVRRTHGLLVSVDPGAPWSAPSRIRVAQALAQRYIGGLLWVGDRTDEASGYFFSEGFSRAIATRVLFDLGTLDHADRAAEVNTWLMAIDLSPVGAASLSELSRAKDDEGVRVLSARGALLALTLDQRGRREAASKHSLKTFVRDLLASAARDERDTLALPAFFETIGAEFGAAAASEARADLVLGHEAVVPSDALGPCYRLVRKPVAPFELGFTTSQSTELTVGSVTAGSRAERAGLRPGDVVRELRYEDGRSDRPVDIVIVRNGQTKTLGFLPTSAPKPGRSFERVRGVSDERC